MNIKRREIFFTFLFVTTTLLFFGNQKALAANDCGTAAFKPDWKCTDINGENNIFNAKAACVTGHCDGGSNIQCCRQDCDAGESCQVPTSGLTCVSRGVCEGARSCCKAGAGSTSQSPTTTGGGTSFTNPLAFNSVEEFLGGIMSAIQKIIVALALVFITIGSVMILVSAGDSGLVEKGKGAITMALVGLALGVAAPSLLKELAGIIGWGGASSVAGALTLTQIALRVLNFLLGTMGIIALVMMVIGATLYLTSAGDEDRIDTGKDIFKYSVIGIIMAMSAMILVKQVAQFFT